MSEWIAVIKKKPPIYRNVLMAFEDHWNQVVGFRVDKNGWYETSAHDHNSRVKGPGPTWWMEIPDVPHSPRVQQAAATSISRI